MIDNIGKTMKNKLFALLGMFFSGFKPQTDTIQPVIRPAEPGRFQHYTGSIYEGSYVWSDAMNMNTYFT